MSEETTKKDADDVCLAIFAAMSHNVCNMAIEDSEKVKWLTKQLSLHTEICPRPEDDCPYMTRNGNCFMAGIKNREVCWDKAAKRVTERSRKRREMEDE